MSAADIAFWLNLGGIACWVICFAWMYRISSKQNRLLTELCAQSKRIEELSKEEHALIEEVHPQVGDIKAGVEKVVSEVENGGRR